MGLSTAEVCQASFGLTCGNDLFAAITFSTTDPPIVPELSYIPNKWPCDARAVAGDPFHTEVSNISRALGLSESCGITNITCSRLANLFAKTEAPRLPALRRVAHSESSDPDWQLSLPPPD